MTDVRLVGAMANCAMLAIALKEHPVTDVRLVGANDGASGQSYQRTAFKDPDMTDVRLGASTSEKMGNVGRPKRSIGKDAEDEVTDVRLVGAKGGGHGTNLVTFAKPEGEDMTDVRLVGANGDSTDGGQRYQRTAFAKPGEGEVTDVRLVGSNTVENCPQRRSGLGNPAPYPLDTRPALLVSYAYYKQFAKFRHEYHFRDYSLDSGAFTVHNSGGEVDLAEYVDFCAERMRNDDKLAEIFALDVIAKGERDGARTAAASARNTEHMWDAGIPAIPCYHTGEPEEFLVEMARKYPKIALGGLVGMGVKEKRRWCEQCFARVWPKRIHGFGLVAKEIVEAMPFDSVDASNWELGPAKYGNWRSLGNPRGLRGGKINLRMEVEHYLKLERHLKQRWAKELAKLPPYIPLHQRRDFDDTRSAQTAQQHQARYQTEGNGV